MCLPLHQRQKASPVLALPGAGVGPLSVMQEKVAAGFPFQPFFKVCLCGFDDTDCMLFFADVFKCPTMAQVLFNSLRSLLETLVMTKEGCSHLS